MTRSSYQVLLEDAVRSGFSDPDVYFESLEEMTGEMLSFLEHLYIDERVEVEDEFFWNLKNNLEDYQSYFERPRPDRVVDSAYVYEFSLETNRVIDQLNTLLSSSSLEEFVEIEDKYDKILSR